MGRIEVLGMANMWVNMKESINIFSHFSTYLKHIKLYKTIITAILSL